MDSFIDGANLQCLDIFFSNYNDIFKFTIINVEYIGFILPLNIF